MKKLLLVFASTCLAIIVNAQTADYRDVATGYYHCSRIDTFYTNNSSIPDSTGQDVNDFTITTVGPESDSTIAIASSVPANHYPQNSFGAMLKANYTLIGTSGPNCGDEIHASYYTNTDSLIGIEYFLITCGDVIGTSHYTCAKTAPLSVAESAINTNVIAAYTDGALRINQQGKMHANLVKLFTVDGKELLTQQLTTSTQTIAAALNTGIYLLVFYNNSQFVGSKKVVVGY